jgi:hypothetical protein
VQNQKRGQQLNKEIINKQNKKLRACCSACLAKGCLVSFFLVFWFGESLNF